MLSFLCGYSNANINYFSQRRLSEGGVQRIGSKAMENYGHSQRVEENNISGSHLLKKNTGESKSTPTLWSRGFW
jgi:hypothetical protein